MSAHPTPAQSRAHRGARRFRELVTPERLVLSEDVDEVIIPGYEGEFGVLPEHTLYLSIVKVGVLR
ncbi:MAG TPA: hypothetical protein VN408_10740, partial [Actinoplanes sp.]|nr:hypothetical protein [Actinoplanes sp.]